MQDKIQQRLTELKSEFAKGQHQLEELENQAAALRNTLLRISGAIQVLEELVQTSSPETNGVAGHAADVSGVTGVTPSL